MFSIAADERAALQFDDLASALDAGLPIAAAGGDVAAGDRAVHGAMRARGVLLTPTEDLMLLHAWRAGRIGTALRDRALARHRRADFVRLLWSGLRYPLLLAVMVLVASATTALTGSWGFTIGVAIAYALLGAAAVAVWRALHRGEPWATRLPVIGRLAVELAELPYLETLHALYASGVPLKSAHSAAVATVKIPAVGDRLRIADRVLQSGRPLREALAESAALHAETRTLIATGEQTGQLENALDRALQRRRDVTGRDVATTAKRAGQIAYGIAVVLCVVVIFRFYSSYYGAMHW
jgi:type II secretory pathway component PulF